jgi:hypothetical protein
MKIQNNGNGTWTLIVKISGVEFKSEPIADFDFCMQKFNEYNFNKRD